MSVGDKEHSTSYRIRLLVSGGAAGVVSKTAVAPFERIKIVCQTGASTTGMFSSALKIIKSEGVFGFWKGNWPACARILPHKGILFACTDLYRIQWKSYSSASISSPVLNMLAGSTAGITASVLTYPLDFVRTRISGTISRSSSLTRQSTGIAHTLLRTIRNEGFWAVYRGIGPTMLGAIPYEGIKFGTFDWLKQNPTWQSAVQTLVGNSPSAYVAEAAVAGAIAGIVATVLTYPNDTVRRRLQMQGKDGKSREYRNAVDCYRKLIKREGVASLYRGLAPTLVRAIPNMGIQFSAYEAFRNLLGCPRKHQVII